MGIAKLYGQKASGANINGIIRDYHAYAGENISAGDFVEFVNGVAGSQTFFNSPLTYSGNYTTKFQKALLMDTNKVLLIWVTSDSLQLYGAIATINTSDISVNTPTSILTVSSAITSMDATNLSKDSAIIVYTSSSTTYAVGMTLSSTNTFNIGTAVSFSSGSSSYPNEYAQIEMVDSTQAIAVCSRQRASTSSTYGLKASVLTLSGTTVTANGTSTVDTHAHYDITLQRLNNSTFFVGYRDSNSSQYGTAKILTRSGTTISSGSEYKIKSFRTDYLKACTINPTKLIITFSEYGNNYISKLKIANVSGTTITFGAEYSLYDYNTSMQDMCLINENKVLIASNTYGNSAYNARAVVASINGDVITLGTSYVYLIGNYAQYNSTALISDGVVFLSYQSGELSNKGVAQLLSIENTTIGNQLRGIEYEPQVRKITTPNIYGVAKTAGLGACSIVDYTIPEGESVSKGENREYNVETLVQEDLFPKTWTRENSGYTLYTSGEFTLTANSIYQTGLAVDKLCNGSLTDYWRANTGSLIDLATMELPEATKITKMKICILTADAFKHATVQGSHDNSTWIDLYTETTVTNDTLTEMVLNNADYYKYYRLRVVKKEDAQVGVREWQVSEYVKFIPYTATALESGTAGDTIQLAVPISNEESTGHKDMISIYTQPLNNLVKNSYFEDGLEGWGSFGNGYATMEIENGILKTVSTVDSVNNTVQAQTEIGTVTVGHKYYWRLTIKANSEVVGTPRIYINGIYYESLVTKQDSWQIWSNVIEVTQVGKHTTLWLSLLQSAVGDTVYWDNVELYDLTAYFGEGNEPTKEWCDANLNPIKPEEYQRYNLVKNGEFNDNLDNWTAGSTDIGSFDRVGMDERVCLQLYRNSTETANSIFRVKQNVNIDVTNHKMYIGGFIRGSISSSKTGTAQLGISYTQNSTNYSWSIQQQEATTLTEWTYISKIFDLTDSNTIITSINCDIFAGATDTYVFWDDIKLYDLTAIFGAGNEPTKEWCDENL